MQVAHIQKEIFLLIQTRKTEEKKTKTHEKPEKLSFYELCRFLTVVFKWKTFNEVNVLYKRNKSKETIFVFGRFFT